MTELSPDSMGAIKRLDFEDISVTMPSPTVADLRRELDNICRGLDDVIDMSQALKEVMETAMECAKTFEGTDFSKLKALFAELRFELSGPEAENHFLDYLEAEHFQRTWPSIDYKEGEILQEDLDENKLKTAEVSQTIKSLMETFATDMESFEEELKLTHGYLDICEKKISDWEKSKSTPNISEVINHSIGNGEDANTAIIQLEEELSSLMAEETDLLNQGCDIDAHALQSRTLDLDFEMMGIEKQIEQKERDLERLQELAQIQMRATLLQTVLEFLGSVVLVGYEDGQIEMIPKIPNLQMEKARDDLMPDLRLQKVVGSVKYKFLIRVDKTKFTFEEAKLDPHDIPINDIISAAKERFKEPLYSSMEHMDLKFSLRKILARIFISQLKVQKNLMP